MNTNKITIKMTIVIILLIIFIPTICKVIDNHYNNLYKVVNQKVIEAAKKCYYEEKCLNNKITLKELYDLEYLDIVSDPVSKENYNVEYYVEISNNEFKFIKE